MMFSLLFVGLVQSVSVQPTNKIDSGALLRVLGPFMSNDKLTADQIEAAYNAKDKYGQKLPLPPRKMLVSEADEDKDGTLTAEELQAWKGYEGRAYCRNPGDAMYGCLDRCMGGVEHIDGDAGFFDKYTVDQQSYPEDENMDLNRKAKYTGGFTRAQRIVIKRAIRNYAAKKPAGAIVQVGMKDMHSWRMFYDTLANASDKTSEIHLYDSFTGFAQCDYAHDTGMCPPKGTAAVDQGALKTDIETYGDVNRVKIHKVDYSSIPASELPSKISLALVDGALFTTVQDMLKSIHSKLAPGAVVFIHDFGWEGFPGVERGVTEYLNGVGKGMHVVLPGSEDGVACYLGQMTV